MRRTTLLVLVCLLVVGGCWITRDRVASPEDDAPVEDVVIDTPEEEVEPPQPELDPPLYRAQGEYYEAFDLLKNRPLAHRSTTEPEGRSTWLDASRFDFARYVQGNHHRGWFLDVEIEGDDGETSRGAAVQGRRAELTMPAHAGEADIIELRVFNPARGDNHLAIELNGTNTRGMELETGWQIAQVELGEATIETENTLALEFSNLGRIEGALSGGALDWVRLGPVGPESDQERSDTDAGSDAGDADEDQDQELEDKKLDGGDGAQEAVGDRPHELIFEQKGALNLGASQGLFWTIWLHHDALIELEVGAEPGCGPTVDVVVETGDGGVETVLREQIELVEGRGDVQTTTLDPGVDDEQVARLELAAPEQGQGCGDIVLETARIVRPGEIDGVPDDFIAPKYVVFWVIDTLRADYLPLHFDTDVEAPNLQRLAEGGVSFETAYVQGTESRASHASLFTGQYPDLHGVMAGSRVDPNLPILPHVFGDQGYDTANLSANGYVSHLLNLDRGWDYYRNYIHEEIAVHAEALVADGLNWISERGDNRFLMYFGTIDPHATYRRHDEFIGLYEPEDYSGRFQRHLAGVTLGEIKAGSMQVTEREKERIINLYKNEITYNDYAFGKVREALEEQGIWEETLVVVTSDHGEEFWEHGSVGHGHNVHQEMVHVPLLFHYPKQLPKGRTVRSGGEVIDILPTIVSMFGAEPFDDRQGMDLLPTIYGEHGGYPAPVLATQYQNHYGLQIRHWKLYLRSGSLRLYNRSKDPGEHSNVRTDHPLASRWLQDSVGLFRAYREEWNKSTWGVLNNVSAEFLELLDADK